MKESDNNTNSSSSRDTNNNNHDDRVIHSSGNNTPSHTTTSPTTTHSTMTKENKFNNSSPSNRNNNKSSQHSRDFNKSPPSISSENITNNNKLITNEFSSTSKERVSHEEIDLKENNNNTLLHPLKEKSSRKKGECTIEEMDLDQEETFLSVDHGPSPTYNKDGYTKILSRECSPSIKPSLKNNSSPSSYQTVHSKNINNIDDEDDDIGNNNNKKKKNIENSLLLQSYDEENQITIDDIIEVDKRDTLSAFKLFALTVSFLGVQFGWALQIAFSTPLFLELGVPSFWVSFIWMAGPISGLIVQPIVGVVSDVSESKHGRRRPFIFFGTIFIAVGLLLVSNAQSIGSIFGSDSKDASIFIAIIGFWILDLSNNVVQAPCRALLVDVAPTSQQGLGSSLFSIMLGIGNLLGYFMGSLNLVKALPFMKTDIRALFTISIITLLLCISMTLISVKEKRYSKPINDLTPKVNPFQAILNGIRDMPMFLKRVCIVQFFSWIGWFCFVLYVTTWVGVNVYQGDPNAPEGSPGRDLFQQGVRRGSLGLMMSSGVSIVTSLLIPTLIRLVGIKYVYFAGNAIQTLLFALFFICKSKLWALLLIGATGIPWSVVMVLPFTIVGLGISSSESGLHMGTLNVFVVIPQLLVSLGISFVISLFGGDLSYSLLTGSIASLLATFATIAIIVPNTMSQIDIDNIQ
ncbi:sucrose proton symporter [Cavenderia fasciculata]|uniref:Sucrose proton symporter n=1 Tax=Cavenderia fasciculata TaxID=261658 RepID=F4PLG0_CACFS|nr:sucrose proton symporter [Cavenderia fasciculata]EGG23382.1 sucrose proton symporter [Cavenderia fasciculata]|eukprot:XP_004361233.1 sucrose proton symporter [Cavenderia fasciculata]